MSRDLKSLVTVRHCDQRFWIPCRHDKKWVKILKSLHILKLNIPIIKKIVYSTLLVGVQKIYGQVATNKFVSLVTMTDLKILVAVAHCDERFKIPRHSQSL